MNLLIQFRHGLGDAIQLTSVLAHLRHYHSDWDVDIAALAGKHTAYRGQCRGFFVLGRNEPPRSQYGRVLDLDWHEPHDVNQCVPSTKVERCLQEVFGLAPLRQLCAYHLDPGAESLAAAATYLEALAPRDPATGRYKVVILHYQGNTSQDRKDLSHDVAKAICDQARDYGYVPVILDWDQRSPIPDRRLVHCPDAGHWLWSPAPGTGDAERLAALIGQSALFIGVDSGPQKVAAATGTPTIAVWTRHHPIHFHGLSNHTLHLVPEEHGQFIRGDRDVGEKAFAELYRSQTYRDLRASLYSAIHTLLTGHEARAETFAWKALRSTAFNANYYEEHRAAGLDYLNYGAWQSNYGLWLTNSLNLRGKKVLDIGCACGSIVRGLGEAGAVVCGVDINEHMIHLGRQRWPDMSPLLHVCDAINLHLFQDGAFDAVHSAQVAEHWRPDHVPLILRELARVTRPGGLLWVALDTEELFARQKRRIEYEDPTHVCIRPLSWWHEQLRLARWYVMSEEVRTTLTDDPGSYLRRYDWDWFAARRQPASEAQAPADSGPAALIG